MRTKQFLRFAASISGSPSLLLRPLYLHCQVNVPRPLGRGNKHVGEHRHPPLLLPRLPCFPQLPLHRPSTIGINNEHCDDCGDVDCDHLDIMIIFFVQFVELIEYLGLFNGVLVIVSFILN